MVPMELIIDEFSNFLWILMDSEALDFLNGFFWLKLIIDEFSNFRAILI